MSSRDVLSGTILNKRYEVGELLGSGGFGATYHARDRARFDAPCVVKELLPGRRDNATARRLFEREARLLFALSHPQIPTLHAYFEEDERFYLVQDYVHGQTLKDRLNRTTRLTEADTAQIVDSVLGVLEYLHGREPPVIHRDIKPANIILGDDGVVYLIDFGAVREVLGPDDNQTAIGTAGYTPREQAVGRPRPSSDLYALGATALEMVSGQHPLEWHDRSTGQLDWKGKAVLSPSFERVLDGMLVDVPRRFPTADVARAALHTEFPNLAGTTSVPTPVAMTPVMLTPLSNTPISVTPVTESATRDLTDRSTSTSEGASGTTGPLRFFLAGAGALILLLLAFKLLLNDKAPGADDGVQTSAQQRTVPIDAPSGDSQFGEPKPAPAGTVGRTPDSAAIVTPNSAEIRESNTSANVPSSGTSEKKGDNIRTPSVQKRDKTAPVGPKSDSASIECSRLIERLSLGQTLTAQQTARLRSNCQGVNE